MPTQSKAVDKFQLVHILSTVIRAIEDDKMKTCKISFNQTATGIFNVSVFYVERNG